MPKINKYDYPFRDLDSCVDFIRKAHDQAKSYVMTRDIFAQAIGLSVKGGGFNLLVGSMSIYKLIETGEGEIRFTELAKKILHGETAEKRDALIEATRNVTLFADLYDTYKTIPTDEQIRLFLRNKAGADIGQAKAIAVPLSKLLKKVSKYLLSSDGKQESESGGENKEVSETEISTTVSLETYMLGNGVQIKLPKEDTEQAWNKAKRALDIILGVEK